MEVFKVFTQDKVRCSALLSRTFTILFLVEIFKLFVSVRAQQRLPAVQPGEPLQGFFFFALFQFEKSAEVTRQVRAGVAANTSSWTPAADEVEKAAPLSSSRSAVQHPSMEAAVAFDVVEYVECHTRWWGCQWDMPVGPAEDGSRLGKVIWRPPWAIGTWRW